MPKKNKLNTAEEEARKAALRSLTYQIGFHLIRRVCCHYALGLDSAVIRNSPKTNAYEFSNYIVTTTFGSDHPIIRKAYQVTERDVAFSTFYQENIFSCDEIERWKCKSHEEVKARLLRELTETLLTTNDFRNPGACYYISVLDIGILNILGQWRIYWNCGLQDRHAYDLSEDKRINKYRQHLWLSKLCFGYNALQKPEYIHYETRLKKDCAPHAETQWRRKKFQFKKELINDVYHIMKNVNEGSN